MDLKSDEILNNVIDPAILLSYELDKLNLDNIPNDIFEFSEEISKNYNNLDGENVILPENKIAETSGSKKKCTLKLFTTEDNLCSSKLKLETYSDSEKPKYYINGNEEPLLYENLNGLFDEFNLSDSDNSKEELSDFDNSKEELSDFDNSKVEFCDTNNGKIEFTDSDNDVNEDHSNLKERGPLKTQSRAKKNRDQCNILNKNISPDKSQFNPETLKFLSGSSQIKFNEPNTTDEFTIHPSGTSIFTKSENVSSIQDYFYGDARAKAVSSPESGYETSSAQSGSSSPPLFPLSTSHNLDYIPETVDEQNILEFLVENSTDCALTEHNVSLCDSDSKDVKGKITEIINYLKDIPDEYNESSSVAAFSNSIEEYVPLVNTTHFNTKSHQASCNPVSKSAESPKKIVYKLDDKAKRTLREFLSKDEFFAAQAKIYRRIGEAANCNDVKVIYVEDETDKASENRTNLHYAVLESRIEDIFCLIEIHKQYNGPLTDINIRDKHGKTALDYAVQNQMTLIVDYLKENTACQSVNI